MKIKRKRKNNRTTDLFRDSNTYVLNMFVEFGVFSN